MTWYHVHPFTDTLPTVAFGVRRVYNIKASDLDWCQGATTSSPIYCTNLDAGRKPSINGESVFTFLGISKFVYRYWGNMLFASSDDQYGVGIRCLFSWAISHREIDILDTNTDHEIYRQVPAGSKRYPSPPAVTRILGTLMPFHHSKPARGSGLR